MADTPDDVSSQAKYSGLKDRHEARPKATTEAIFSTRGEYINSHYGHKMSLVALSYLDAARKSLVKRSHSFHQTVTVR